MNNTREKRIPVWLKIIWIIMGLYVLAIVWPILDNMWNKSDIKPIEQVTHSCTEDLEQYVYENSEGKVFFGEPIIDEENKKAELVVIIDEGQSDRVFDATRILINEYLELNDDYYLNDGYKIVLSYQERDTSGGSSGTYRVGYASNYIKIDRFSSVLLDGTEIRLEGICAVICSMFYPYTYILESSDIRALTPHATNDQNAIITIVNNMHNLQYLDLSYWDHSDIDQLINSIHEINPDLIVLWDTE